MITGAPKANEAEVVHGGPLSSMSYVEGIIDTVVMKVQASMMRSPFARSMVMSRL